MENTHPQLWVTQVVADEIHINDIINKKTNKIKGKYVITKGEYL